MSTRIKICVASTIPGLYETLCNRVSNAEIFNLCVNQDNGKTEHASGIEDHQVLELRNCEVFLGDPDVLPRYNLLYQLPRLKWCQSTWAGVDSLMKNRNKSMPNPNFTVTRFAGYFGPVMGEYVIGHIVAHERQFFETKSDQKERKWNTNRGVYRLLSELSIGILGVGDIGQEIAKMCQAFGMTVWGVGRREPGERSKCPHVDHYTTTDDLSTVIRECDYICNILPHTPKTIALLDSTLMAHGRNKKTVFINIGRGSIISENSLLESLEKRYLSHAILDVFEEEPLKNDSLLWNHPAVTISPHVSGMSTKNHVVALFEKNLHRYQTGVQLLHIVDWEEGY